MIFVLLMTAPLALAAAFRGHVRDLKTLPTPSAIDSPKSLLFLASAVLRRYAEVIKRTRETETTLRRGILLTICKLWTQKLLSVQTTEVHKTVCQTYSLAVPRQSQAEQISKIRIKLLAPTCATYTGPEIITCYGLREIG